MNKLFKEIFPCLYCTQKKVDYLILKLVAHTAATVLSPFGTRSSSTSIWKL